MFNPYIQNNHSPLECGKGSVLVKQQTGCSPIISLAVKSKYDSGNDGFAQSLKMCPHCPTTDNGRLMISKNSFLKVNFKESAVAPSWIGRIDHRLPCALIN